MQPEVLDCACASVRRAARLVTVLYETSLREAGLRATQFTLLQVIDRLGRRGRARQSDVGELLALDPTTLTRTLRPLARAGWIRAERGRDRRERCWALTPAGRVVLERARPAWHTAQVQMRRRLGSNRWKPLLRQLASLGEVAAQTDQTD